MKAMTLAVALVTTGLLAQGVTDTEIHVGQACALKGQAAGLGTGMKTGLEVWFDKVNHAGGIHGRKIKLTSVNDGYEPKRCERAVKMLIEKRDVFAIIGGVGTPTAKVAVPICTEAKVPFLGAFTGAELLRSPHNRYVVNLRGSYFQETEALAEWLVDQQGMKRIACFYQNDAYGQAGLSGIERALQRRDMKLVSTGTYKRNTLAVAKGLKDVAAGEPQAVLLIGAYAPCAQFMKQARETAGLESTTMCNISFVGSNKLMAAAGAAGEGSLISQVVPLPTDPSTPIVGQYLADMKAAGKQADIGFTTLEGYCVARLFTELLQRNGRELTRDSLLDTVAGSGPIDLGGLVLTYGPKDNQGSDKVWLTTIRGGKVTSLGAPAATPGK